MTAWDTIKSVATKLVHDEMQTLQVRLFRLIALAVAIICLFVVVPVNLLVGLPWGENFISVLLTGFGFFLYQQSLKGKNYFFLIIVVLVFAFDLCWFMEGGSFGSMTFYFFPILLYSMTTFRGRKLWLANGFVVLNTCLLFVLEYFYPSLITPFRSPESRLLDLATGCVCVFFTIGLITWLIVANYDWERERIARFARELGISEKNYRDVVEKAKSLIVRLDGKGNVTFFNKYAEDLLGIKRQEVLQRPFLGTVVMPPAGDGQMAGLIQSLLTDPAKHPQTEFESVNRDGRRIRVIWFNQPVYDEAGGLNEILCVGTDVTERSALLERLQVTQRTVDTAGDQVLWMDQAGRIVAGNQHALALVRVPTEAEERARTESRLRQSLRKDLKRIPQRGRGLALQYGYRLKGCWHGPRTWPHLEIPGWLVQLLTPLQAAAVTLNQLVKEPTAQIESQSTQPRPKGLGKLTEQLISRELCDPKRFQNRRQVSSYLGLCPGEHSSGARQQRGHITKTGNPRLRWALCEAAWRLVRFQPDYRLCKKWREQILNPKLGAGRRKQLIVALARGFGVDWWRLCTGQTTAEKLGLKMAD
jgi:PAS domain S-box-containing protein